MKKLMEIVVYQETWKSYHVEVEGRTFNERAAKARKMANQGKLPEPDGEGDNGVTDLHVTELRS